MLKWNSEVELAIVGRMSVSQLRAKRRAMDSCGLVVRAIVPWWTGYHTFGGLVVI